MTRLADTSRNMRLLLVEDCEGDVLLFRRGISSLNLKVELSIAPSAEAAFAHLATGDLPDLIVTDLNLPHMPGLDFVEAVKSDAKLRRIPVLVMSNSTSGSDIAAAYDRQANGYFAKPAGPDAYAEMLEAMTSYWCSLMQLPSDRLPGIRE